MADISENLTSGDPMEVQFFMAPHGIVIEDSDGKSTPLMGLIDTVKNGNVSEVAELADILDKQGLQMKELYTHLSDNSKWLYSEDGYLSPSFRLSEGGIDVTIYLRRMPDEYEPQGYGHWMTEYACINIYNNNTKIRVSYGIGFITRLGNFFNDYQYQLFIIHYLQNLFSQMAKKKPEELPNLDDNYMVAVSQEAINGAITALKQISPVDLRPISLVLNPSIQNLTGLVEDTIVALVPGVIGKVLVYIVFQILNAFFFSSYSIRYVIVNLSEKLPLQLSDVHNENIDKRKLPDILKGNTKTNIISQVARVPYYNEDSDSYGHIKVMQAPAFALTNNSGGPGVLYKLTDPSSSPKNLEFQNIYSAYDIFTADDNTQGIDINNSGTVSRKIYDDLTNYIKDRYIHMENHGVKLSQLTNKLNGADNGLYDVALIIEDA